MPQALATSQELTAGRESRGVARESPWSEWFENREERFRIGFVGVRLFVVTSLGLFRRGPLAIVGAGSVLAKKMLVKQRALHRL